MLVPYPIESGLSRIQRHEDRMWYRRTFTVPAGWSGRRVRLNFGAVSWETRVWVNGTAVGAHTGGYDPFGFDITPALRSGSNELIVGVYAPVDATGAPIGKQRRSPAASSTPRTPASGRPCGWSRSTPRASPASTPLLTSRPGGSTSSCRRRARRDSRSGPRC
ncbi:sugar-binding domain-containing protein [Nonomuraea thailandensis]